LEMIVANLEKEKDEKDTGGENDQNKNKWLNNMSVQQFFVYTRVCIR
jgi:hypothetical protein